ncbi:MAG: hypothetical protein EOP86_27640 [Verrucomicrobiaceae bacterium]|nr:MAG: hypothetical protein EOP86_27640 [Verrucomicrobiaceae bacterium]
MAFRAPEYAESGLNQALQQFIYRNLSAERERSEAPLRDLIDQFGPVVHSYPHWHPLVTSGPDGPTDHPETIPGRSTGFEGLDHTLLLRNAFITCPYGGEDTVHKSVARLAGNPLARITSENLDFPLYAPNASPVLVRCEWSRPMETDGTIPLAVAAPLLLEREMPAWRTAQCSESWEAMRGSILGEPGGKRSSLFVNQETGQALKNLWQTLMDTGMFGPPRAMLRPSPARRPGR